MSAPLSQWFRPVSEGLEDLVTASRVSQRTYPNELIVFSATRPKVQHNMLVSLVRHYRQRYDNAKVVVKQLQAELAALQGQLALVAVTCTLDRLTCLIQSARSTRGYSRTPPRIPIANQMPIHEHGYTSTTSSASKRRRIDMETEWVHFDAHTFW